MKKKVDNKNVVRYLKTLLIVGVAVILVTALGSYALVNYFLIQSKILPQGDEGALGIFWVIAFTLFCIAMGVGLSFVLGKLLVRPVRKLIEGMTELSEGNFSTRISLGKYVDNTTEITKTFNLLAKQLQSTEILRSDFVNNFSHEVKTPLVSITGLMSLLKKDNLSKEKRLQYIELIEEEVQRLSSMTTNMLNLSKLEKQEILSDKTKFNLSEQIRTCVLLLEKKWTKKKTRLALDFDEHTLFASEDLMKQVWINLIDNAIKFSKEKATVSISISESENDVTVSVANTGEKIREEDLDKIFNKFFQSDESRNKEGHGIGLSIVKRIIYLHEGKINVTSTDEKTVFTVVLPKTRQD